MALRRQFHKHLVWYPHLRLFSSFNSLLFPAKNFCIGQNVPRAVLVPMASFYKSVLYWIILAKKPPPICQQRARFRLKLGPETWASAASPCARLELRWENVDEFPTELELSFTLPWARYVVQCSAVQCSAVECSAVQCSAVQCSAVHWDWGDRFYFVLFVPLIRPQSLDRMETHPNSKL